MPKPYPLAPRERRVREYQTGDETYTDVAGRSRSDRATASDRIGRRTS